MSGPLRHQGLRHRLVCLAKAVRSSQPFNTLATTGVRAALRALGREPDAFVKHLHRVGGVSCRLPNGRTLRLWTRADDFIPNQLFWRGWRGHEPETASVLWHLASSARTTIDVGANVGVFALLAAHANPSGRVFAFEPFRPVFDRLEVNRARNDVPNLECVRVAVGEVEGTLDYYDLDFGNDDLPSSTSLSLEFMERSRLDRGLPESRLRRSPTTVLTLDAFAGERGIEDVDLVKIDTESTEPSVLRGMTNVLKRSRPNLIVEILPGLKTLPEIEMVLAPLGYRHCRLVPSSDRDKASHEAVGRITGRFDGFDNFLFSTGDPCEIVAKAALFAK